jgi:GT2 family glycosyltransferase
VDPPPPSGGGQWPVSPNPPEPKVAANVDGFVELYAWHEIAEAWVVTGWVSRARLTDAPVEVSLTFTRGTVTGTALIAFHDRLDLAKRGVGVILALPAEPLHLGKLAGLVLKQDGKEIALRPTSEASECTGAAITGLARPALESPITVPDGLTADRTRLRELLTTRVIGEGYLDFYGFHAASSGTFIVGWVSESWIAAAKGERRATANFEGGRCAAGVVLNFYDRPDIRGTGLGIVLHVPDATPKFGRLLSVRLQAGRAVVSIRASDAVRLIAAEEATTHFQPVIARSDAGPARDTLRHLVERRVFEGRDTLASLTEKIMIEFDEVIACPPDSIVLCGWMLAAPGAIRALRARGGSLSLTIDPLQDGLPVARQDVIDATGSAHGFDDPRCGFLLRVPIAFPMPADLHLEVETVSGEIGFRTIPTPRLTGIAAIRRLLGSLDVQHEDVDRIFDTVLGPAVTALNARRLQEDAPIVRAAWGEMIEVPQISLIVPLYGRIDFLEYQMALFADHGLGDDVEIIYVLDDPPLLRRTRFLAASVHARFGVPFRLLSPGRNLGFAPANNAGLREARGEFVCFMNSDVFPMDGTWLHRLTARLQQDASLGVVGPLLLYEDGSVQHQGIDFKKLPQYGNWWFSQHPRKGWRPEATGGLSRPLAITGACMVLRRADAIACGGFDEAYVIGDFEDTDLCFRLAGRGLQAAIDLDVSLLHLERQSQAGSASPWRTNLTLFNAWVHQRRWADLITRENRR